ncbi:hypothetical protein V8C86DRAFT_2719285 [Haematococcus lacustris]
MLQHAAARPAHADPPCHMPSALAPAQEQHLPGCSPSCHAAGQRQTPWWPGGGGRGGPRLCLPPGSQRGSQPSLPPPHMPGVARGPGMHPQPQRQSDQAGSGRHAAAAAAGTGPAAAAGAHTALQALLSAHLFLAPLPGSCPRPSSAPSKTCGWPSLPSSCPLQAVRGAAPRPEGQHHPAMTWAWRGVGHVAMRLVRGQQLLAQAACSAALTSPGCPGPVEAGRCGAAVRRRGCEGVRRSGCQAVRAGPGLQGAPLPPAPAAAASALAPPPAAGTGPP